MALGAYGVKTVFLPLLWKPLAEWPVLPWAKGEGEVGSGRASRPSSEGIRGPFAGALAPSLLPVHSSRDNCPERKGMECPKPQAPSLQAGLDGSLPERLWGSFPS